MVSLEILRDFNEFRQSPPGDTICPAPLMNLHFSQLGVVSACCFNRTAVLGVYPENSIEQIWNGEPARELRELLAKHDLSRGCDKCQQQIEARDFGGSHAAFYTLFSRHLSRQQRELGIAPRADAGPMPMKLEFNIHNSCNLQCIMCHGLASSSIAKHREAMPAMPNPYDDAFVDQLEPYLAHVVEADFMGGEPFLMPSYRRLWERIARVNPQTRALILTNGTILDDEIKSLLERLNCSIHMSIDSDVTETYESIRRGASYATVMANADYYRALMLRKGYPFIWRYCPMRLNWRELPDTARRCNEKGILLHFNQLDSPINFSLTTLPPAELEDVVRHLEKNGPKEESTDVEKGNRTSFVELTQRLRGFLEPTNRRNGLVARLDVASAVVSRYSGKRSDTLKKRLTLVESQNALTEAAKSYVITKLNVEQAVTTEAQVPTPILERLTQRTAELFQAGEGVEVAVFVRTFLDETVRTYSGVWGVYTTHDPQTFERIVELASWMAKLEDRPSAVRAMVATPPAELYRLVGLSTSLAEAKARFGDDARTRRDEWQAHHSRGDSALQSAAFEEAIAAYELAVSSDPTATVSYVNMGHGFCNLGRWEDAARAYGRALELDPDVGGICQNLGDVRLKLGRYAEAVDAYQRAIVERPDAASSHINLGHAFSHLSRWNEAIDAYRAGLEHSGQDSSPLHNLADALLCASRWDEAVDAYRHAIAKHPGIAASHANLGHSLSHLCRWDEAVVAYEAALKADASQPGVRDGLARASLQARRKEGETASIARPRNDVPRASTKAEPPGSYVRRADALCRLGKWEEAAVAYERAIEGAPNAAPLHAALGHVLSRSSLWDEAIAAYRRARKLDPTLSGLAESQGNALLNAGRYEDALSAYRQAIREQPSNAGLLVNLGQALSHLNRWEEAADAFGRAAQLAPERASSHMSLGDALWRANRLDDAIAAYREAVRREPGSAAWHMRLGEALGGASRWTEAVAAYEEAMRREPGAAAPYSRLGGALGCLGRWEEAIAAHRNAIQREPERSSHHASLGDALTCSNRRDEAIDAYRSALAREPGSAIFHARLGDALRGADRWDDAVAEYRTALRIDPTIADVHRNIADALSSAGHWEEAAGAYHQAITREIESGTAAGKPIDTQKVSRAFRRLGDSLLKLRRWSDAATAFQRADDFNPSWSRAELGPFAPHLERWAEGSWLPRASEPTPGPRSLFILDSDYGELTEVMFFLFGQELSARTTLVLSERLFVHNPDVLPGRTYPAGSLEDLIRTIDREKPDVVFLCSAYLFSIHRLLALDGLEKLVQHLDQRGCRIATTDPFLYLLFGLGSSTTVSIDIPENAPPEIRRAKEQQDAHLMEHFSTACRVTKRIPHLYPSYPAAVGRTAAADSKVLSFFNPALVLPPPETSAAAKTTDKPRWLFVLATTDYEAQLLFHGREYFVDVVVKKIHDTLNAGRHPVCVLPYDLIQAVIARMSPVEGVTLLTFCPIKKFLPLLVDAEIAFYWNVVSHSMLLRLMNRQAVFMFDRGHLCRNVTPLYERIVDWYYQGQEPLYLNQDSPLVLEDLLTRIEGSEDAWERVAHGFTRAPSPATVVARLVEREPESETTGLGSGSPRRVSLQ